MSSTLSPADCAQYLKKAGTSLSVTTPFPQLTHGNTIATRRPGALPWPTREAASLSVLFRARWSSTFVSSG